MTSVPCGLARMRVFLYFSAGLFFAALACMSPVFASPTSAATLIPEGSTTTNRHFTQAESPYVIDGGVYVTAGTWTFDPGVVVKFKTATSSLIVHGAATFVSLATKNNPVYFTSYHDDAHGGDTNGNGSETTPAPGDWGFLSIGCGSTFGSDVVDFIRVYYGGSSEMGTPSSPALEVCYQKYNGFPIETHTLQNIEVAYGLQGLYLGNTGHQVAIVGASIHDNVNYGLDTYDGCNFRGTCPNTVDGNWWGSAEGPLAEDNPGGTGNRVIGPYSPSPWLTEDPLFVVHAPPTITLHGDATTTIAVGTPFTDPGATATDPTDGDLTSTIQVAGSVDTALIGTTTLTYTVTNSHNLTASTSRTIIVTCGTTCYSNVMFLPGLPASRLYRPDYNGGTNRIWEPNSETDAESLMLGDGSLAQDNDVYARAGDVLENAYGLFSVYDTFVEDMERLKTEGTIADWQPVAYDWRLDYEDLLTHGAELSDGRLYYRGDLAATSSPYIVQELARLASSSRTGKVTIVAHSNGGLLAKALLTHPEYAQYVDKLILVAVPQLGTPKAIGGLLHGYDQALPLSFAPIFFTAGDARAIGLNTPSAYNLLPSNEYFSAANEPVISFDAETLPELVNTYGSEITTPAALRAFMTDSARVQPTHNDVVTPGIASTALFDNAAAVHAVLDDWTPPQDVQLYTIAGWGNETVSGIHYEKLPYLECFKTANTPGFRISRDDCTVSLRFAYKPKTVIDGDGTVMEVSAFGGNIADATNYWVDLMDYDDVHLSLVETAHVNILEIPEVTAFVIDLTKDGSNAQLPDQYISTTKPVESSISRLHFTLHSPLTLGFTDSQGNYTGATVSTSSSQDAQAVFNIPGVVYERLGEVQWLSVPKDLAGQVVMHGTGSGSFALDIEEVSGNTVLATTTFAAVPTATTTTATLVINPAVSPTASSTLVVDYDSNGATDLTLAAEEGSVVVPEIITDVQPPEARILFSATTKNIVVEGMDDTSSTTVTTASSSITIADEAGNTLEFQNQRSINQPNYDALIIPRLVYSTGTTTNATTSLRYFHATDKRTGKYSLFISHIKTPTQRQLAVYIGFLNKTYILESKPQDDAADLSTQSAALLLRKKVKTYNGLHVPIIMTERGVLKVN